jgi:hypothetical protein
VGPPPHPRQKRESFILLDSPKVKRLIIASLATITICAVGWMALRMPFVGYSSRRRMTAALHRICL